FSIIRRLPRSTLFPTRRSSDLLSLYGLCATYLSRKLARYRNMFASPATQALSLGHSFERCPQYTRECQRSTRLAYLRRLRTEPRSEEHTSELQSRENLVCRLLL